MATEPEQAPKFTVPPAFLAIVEHPGVVVNHRNAIKSLGGGRALQESFINGTENKNLGLKTRTDDPYRRPLPAFEVATTNLILKITVPKRTGRRRKRGSDEPFTAPVANASKESPVSTRSLLRRMRDYDAKYEIKVVGTVGETYRFRGLPDFQYSLMSSQTAANFKESVLSSKVEDIKKYDTSRRDSDSPQTADMIPPPVFMPAVFPDLYGYNQNPYVRTIIEPSGRKMNINNQAVGRTGATGVQFDVQEVPAHPDPTLPPEEELDNDTRAILLQIRAALEKRPIFTRRALVNTLGPQHQYNFRFVTPYCVYTFLSGPWRDAMIRLGVDPRKDPEMRIYQTLGIKLLTRADHSQGAVVPAWRQGKTELVTGESQSSHIFNGKDVARDGSTWQFCDITDSFLVQIMNSEPRRKDCDISSWGWFLDVPFCKVHAIMREKNRLLLDGQTPNDADYNFVFDLPNDRQALIEYIKETRTLSTGKRSLATSIRQMTEENKSTRRGGGRSHVQTPNKQALPAQGDEVSEAEGVGEDDEDVE